MKRPILELKEHIDSSIFFEDPWSNLNLSQRINL